MIYVFDTSSCVVLKNYYPNIFPTLWEQLNELIETGRVVSVSWLTDKTRKSLA
jgi:hypothetical protein